jgi:hypothetical protein
MKCVQMFIYASTITYGVFSLIDKTSSMQEKWKWFIVYVLLLGNESIGILRLNYGNYETTSRPSTLGGPWGQAVCLVLKYIAVP